MEFLRRILREPVLAEQPRPPRILSCTVHDTDDIPYLKGRGWYDLPISERRQIINIEWSKSKQDGRDHVCSDVTNKIVMSEMFYSCIGAIVYGQGSDGQMYTFMIHCANNTDFEKLDTDVEALCRTMQTRYGVDPASLQIAMWGGEIPVTPEQRARERYQDYNWDGKGLPWDELSDAERASYATDAPPLDSHGLCESDYYNFVRRFGALLEKHVARIGGNADAWVHMVRAYGDSMSALFDTQRGRLTLYYPARQQGEGNTPFRVKDLTPAKMRELISKTFPDNERTPGSQAG